MENKLMDINILFKELNQVYSEYSKYCNLPEAAVWILYALHHNKKEFTQKELSDLWLFKKQTINSAINVLIKKGYVNLKAFEDNKKSKKVILTEIGEDYMQNHLNYIVKAEENALESLSDNELKQLMSSVGKYSTFLKYEINKLMNSNK